MRQLTRSCLHFSYLFLFFAILNLILLLFFTFYVFPFIFIGVHMGLLHFFSFLSRVLHAIVFPPNTTRLSFFVSFLALMPPKKKVIREKKENFSRFPQ